MRFLTLALILFIILSFACSNNDNDGDGPDFDDTTSPQIAITYPENGDTLYAVAEITVECSDDDMVDRIKYIVDRDIYGWAYDPPFNVDLAFTSDQNGEHELRAMAYDRTGNASLSEPVLFTYLQDLAPDGNRVVYAEIVEYLGDGDLDDDGAGDPYFILSFIESEDTTDFYSITFLDSEELHMPFDAIYDISDYANEFKFALFVYDLDVMGQDWVDYTPDDGGRAYIFTIPTGSMPFDETFNGTEDGITDEPDCFIHIRLTFHIEQ